MVGLCHRMPAVRQPLEIDSGSRAEDQGVGIGGSWAPGSPEGGRLGVLAIPVLFG